MSGLLLNYYLTPSRGRFTIAEPNAVVTEVVLLAVAIAVAARTERSIEHRRPDERPKKPNC